MQNSVDVIYFWKAPKENEDVEMCTCIMLDLKRYLGNRAINKVLLIASSHLGSDN